MPDLLVGAMICAVAPGIGFLAGSQETHLPPLSGMSPPGRYAP